MTEGQRQHVEIALGTCVKKKDAPPPELSSGLSWQIEAPSRGLDHLLRHLGLRLQSVISAIRYRRESQLANGDTSLAKMNSMATAKNAR